MWLYKQIEDLDIWEWTTKNWKSNGSKVGKTNIKKVRGNENTKTKTKREN